MDSSAVGMTKRERNKQARRTVNALAVMLVLSRILSFLLYYAADALAPFLSGVLTAALRTFFECSTGEALLLAENLTSSVMFIEVTSMLYQLVTFFLPFYLLAKHIFGKSFDEVFPIAGGSRLKGFLPIFAGLQLLATAAVCLTDTVGSFVLPDWFGAVAEQMPAEAYNSYDLVVYFLSLCIFTPIIEEFVFRGVIFGELRRFGFGFAAVSSALIFGLAHADISQLVYAVIFGIGFAAVYEKTGSLRATVLLHALNNTVNYVQTVLLPNVFGESVADTFALLYNFIIGALAVLGFVLLFNHKRGERRHAHDTAAEAETEEKAEAETNADTVGFGGFITPGVFCLIAIFLFFEITAHL